MTRYCFGNEADPKAVEKAIHGLRLMAKFGRRAERALAAIGRGEEFPHDVAWLEPHRDRYIGSGLESLAVYAAHSVMEYRPVLREGVPGWGQLDLILGSLDEDKICGSDVHFFEVSLAGTTLRYDSDAGSVFHVKAGPRDTFNGLGSVRLKSNGALTFQPDSRSSGEKKVQRIYRSSDSERNADAIRALAQAAAAVIVPDPPRHGSKADLYPQELKSLRENIPGWLIADGTAADWLRRICDWAASVKVVSEVMEA